MATATLEHLGQHCAGAEHNTIDIGAHDAAIGLIGDLTERFVAELRTGQAGADAGVEERNVECIEWIDEIVPRLGTGYIEMVVFAANFGCHCGTINIVEVGDDDVCAKRGEASCDGGSNAAGAARNESTLSGEIKLHDPTVSAPTTDLRNVRGD